MVRITKDEFHAQLTSSRQECKRSCPVVKMGKLCIEVNPTDKKAFLSEELCIGCGICVKKYVPLVYLDDKLTCKVPIRSHPDS